MSSRSIILEEFAAVAKQQHRILAPLADDLDLLQSGLDSLCLMQIIVRLEDRLGIYPFTDSKNMEFPETIGDFIEMFEMGARAPMRFRD